MLIYLKVLVQKYLNLLPDLTSWKFIRVQLGKCDWHLSKCLVQNVDMVFDRGGREYNPEEYVTEHNASVGHHESHVELSITYEHLIDRTFSKLARQKKFNIIIFIKIIGWKFIIRIFFRSLRLPKGETPLLKKFRENNYIKGFSSMPGLRYLWKTYLIFLLLHKYHDEND